MACPPIEQLEPGFRVLSKEEKGSASKTVLVFGRLDGRAVALKIFAQRGAARAGLLKEVRLYKRVTELLRRGVTLSVVRYVGDWVCAARALAPLGALPRELGGRVGVLATERVLGPSVNEALHEQRLGADALLSVLFQVVHAMGNLSTAGIRHADLHTGNVLLEPQPQRATPFRARLDGVVAYWRLPTPWLAKIFDWDFGDLDDDALPNAHAAPHCARYDLCGHNDKADLYTFLDSVWLKTKKRPRYTAIAETIERWIALPLLEAGATDGLFARRGGMAKRLCRGPIADDRCPAVETLYNCAGPWRPPDCQMLPPAAMLADEVFRRWRVDALPDAWGTTVEFF